MKACRYAKRNGFKSRRMTRNDRYWYERCNRPTCGNKPRVWIPIFRIWDHDGDFCDHPHEKPFCGDCGRIYTKGAVFGVRCKAWKALVLD